MSKIVWDWKSQFTSDSPADVFDCMLAEFLLSEGRSVKPPDNLTSFEELAQKQLEQLKRLYKLYELFTNIDMPLVPVLYRMEQRGITLDVNQLRQVGEEINQAIVGCEETLKKEFGEINLNSSIQVGDFLAQKVGVPLSKTKTGRYATNEGELSNHANQFPIIQHLLTYRELTKLRSTYVESLISKVDDQGRVHTTYSQIGAGTGRLSSSNPNLQNIPVLSEFGQKIKGCFVAEKGKVLVSFDYSQQELRILAHLTGEEALIKAFNENKDVHNTTASLLFKVPYESVTKEQRNIAKTINFGIIYGMSSFGLSNELHIPTEDAQQFIDAFYATYPKIRTFFDQYLRDAKTNKYVETLLGRRRYVFEYPTQKFIDNGMRRVLINFPIQGTAADLMRKAMVQVHQEVVNDSCGLLLQIHDDLVFEMKEDPQTIQKIRDIMCHVHPLSVPIEVDVKVGKSWGEMKKINYK